MNENAEVNENIENEGYFMRIVCVFKSFYIILSVDSARLK